MRATLKTVVALFVSLAAAAPLPAQQEEVKLKPKAAGTVSLTDKINGKTLTEWIREIKNNDPALSEVAIRTVMLFGPDASRDASGPLIDALSFQDTSLRVNACIALTMIGVHESQVNRAVSALTRRLAEDQQSIVRFYAAVALGRLGDAEAHAAIPDLVNKCHDGASWEIRRAAVYALGKAGKATQQLPLSMPAANALISTFTGAYSDRCAEVRLTAVVALGGMGIPPTPGEKEVIMQALNRALNDRYKPVAVWAHMGLMADGDPDEKHLPAIIKFLKGNDFEAHLNALRALGVMGKRAKSAVPDLINELKGTEPMLVATACMALGTMEEHADKAIPDLERLRQQRDTDEVVKQAAGEAIQKIKGQAPKGRN